MTDKNIVRERDENYQEGVSSLQQFYSEAYTDVAYSVGDQWRSEDKTYLAGQGRNAYVFNKIRRIVKMITGYQRRNRLSSVCQAVEGSDEKTAEIFTDLLLWVMQHENGYHKLSNAFEEGACVSGMSMMSLWMDYTSDPSNGDIKIECHPYNSFLIDPYFTTIDLSDCRYLMTRRYMSPDQVKSRLPEMAKEIDDLKPGRPDDKFLYTTVARQTISENLLAFDEYWVRTTRKASILIDNMTGETKIWKGSDKALKAFLSQYPWVSAKTTWLPTVDFNIFVQNEVMYSGRDPYELDDYPYVPVLGFFTPQHDDFSYKIQGIVRCMRDAQEQLNKIRSKASDILDSQVNSGWIVTEGSVTNKKDLFKTGQGVVIERAYGTQPQDVQKIPPVELPQSLFALVAALEKDVMEIPGVNEELLGISDSGNSEISGILAKVRAANGLTTLQDMFDNLSISQKILGSKIIKLIQKNWSADKVRRITNKEPTPDFVDENFGKYDCVVKEAMLTDTQRQLAYAQTIVAKQAGINIPESFVLEMIPIANKQELKESYAQQAKAQMAQQQTAQEQADMLKQLEQAKIISDLSLAAERRSRMVADAGLAKERIAQAGYDRARTITEIMKTVADLQKTQVEMNDQRIVNIQNMVELLRQQDALETERNQQAALKEVLATSALAQGNMQYQSQGEM